MTIAYTEDSYNLLFLLALKLHRFASNPSIDEEALDLERIISNSRKKSRV